MNRIICSCFALLLAAGVGVAKDKATAQPNPQVEKDQTLVRAFVLNIFGQNIQQNTDAALAPGFVDHSSEPSGSGNAPDLISIIGEYHRAFPDLKVTVEDLFSAGDRIAVRGIISGTNLGPWLSGPPSAKPMRASFIDIYRLVEGKIAERWSQVDRASISQQTTFPGAVSLNPLSVPPSASSSVGGSDLKQAAKPDSLKAQGTPYHPKRPIVKQIQHETPKRSESERK